MAAKKRQKIKQANPFSRIVKVVVAVAPLLAGVTLFLTNLDKIGELWRKYFGQEPIAELSSPRNLPTELVGSVEPVEVVLVQAADQESSSRAYDLYLENKGPTDLLLSEVRFGPGAAYASTSGAPRVSGASLPDASYRVVASSSRGTIALTPPYRLRANQDGAMRLVIEANKNSATNRGTIAFELYSATGEKVASVNRMIGE
jgi:hypothetical protein